MLFLWKGATSLKQAIVVCFGENLPRLKTLKIKENKKLSKGIVPSPQALRARTTHFQPRTFRPSLRELLTHLSDPTQIPRNLHIDDLHLLYLKMRILPIAELDET